MGGAKGLTMPLPFSSRALDERLSPQEFAAETGIVLTGVSIKQKPDGWQIVLNGYSRARGPVYCMNSACDDPVTGLHALLDVLGKKGGGDLWRKNKFA